MDQLLARLCQKESFDVVHADQTYMAQYALRVRGAGHGPRALLDQHNAMFKLVRRQAEQAQALWARVLWSREATLLRRYETKLLRRFDFVLTVTEEDRETLLGLLPPVEQVGMAARIANLPICIDPASQPSVPWHNPDPVILHLGTMFWPPNVEGVLWFAEAVLPQVLAELPEARFVVAGKDPPASVRALAKAESPLQGRVEVTGYVADPTPLLSQSGVFVVPLKAGGGMRVKVIDAWQWGIPIVSTTLGAEGIDTRPGENILLADEPEAFAAAVVRLLTDRELARRLRQNGRRWVEERYNWRTVYSRLDPIYESLLHMNP
jgi:polysaccharide biosynthesis protein PslH